MKVIRRTRAWFNPKTQKTEYVQRMELEDRGAVDLVNSLCWKKHRNPDEVARIASDLVDEALQLLSHGNSVIIPNVGVMVPKIVCKQKEYHDHSSFSKADVKEIRFVLHKSRRFTQWMKNLMKYVVIE